MFGDLALGLAESTLIREGSDAHQGKRRRGRPAFRTASQAPPTATRRNAQVAGCGCRSGGPAPAIDEPEAGARAFWIDGGGNMPLMSEETTPQPPPQRQPYPGYTERMDPRPRDEMREYAGRGLLEGQRALITGGDSGIGRAVAVAFAKEGADVAVAYLSEDADAERTAELVHAEDRRCVLLRGDLADEDHCAWVVAETVRQFRRVDVLVNHAGTQATANDLTEISTEQWDRTFKVNIYSMFWITRAALPHIPDGGAIVNTGSINGLRGNKSLIDYSATKGAIHVWTYALAQSLARRGIRANCVAPGPVWTPLIPATFPEQKVERFGEHVPVSRWAHPDEIAPSYVFLAAGDLSSYYTGQVLAPIGGETHPG